MIEPFLSGIGGHPSDKDAGGGAAVEDNNTLANSGGMEPAQTS